MIDATYPTDAELHQCLREMIVEHKHSVVELLASVVVIVGRLARTDDERRLVAATDTFIEEYLRQRQVGLH